MAADDDKSMGPVSIVGGLLLVIVGAWLRSKAPQFTGDWPEALSVGCFIWGAGSVVFGVNKLKK